VLLRSNRFSAIGLPVQFAMVILEKRGLWNYLPRLAHASANQRNQGFPVHSKPKGASVREV
jgi:hypothetical protein